MKPELLAGGYAGVLRVYCTKSKSKRGEKKNSEATKTPEGKVHGCALARECFPEPRWAESGEKGSSTLLHPDSRTFRTQASALTCVSL